MRHQLHTEITIDAEPDRVWEILTDLPSHQDWNPFIVQASGTVATGHRLSVTIKPPGEKARTFTPTVTEAEQPAAFEWLGRLGLPGIFDGRHRFDLEPIAGGGTRLIHREFFRGLLVPLLRNNLDNGAAKGFELMNQALKERAEATVGADE